MYRDWINDRASHYKDFAQACCYKIAQDSSEALLWWVNTFGKAFDPRIRGKSAHSNMIVFPRQEEFFRFIYRKIVMENQSWGSQKSRGFGLSVAFIDFCGWRWMWDENAVIGLVSRKDDLVDSKSPDSLFWKLDYQLGGLPEWQRDIMIPGVEFRLGTEYRSKNILIHPILKNVIRGEATTSSVGAGGRAWCYGVDEAGKIPFLDSIRTTLSGTTDSTGYISTDSPEGPDFTTMHMMKTVEFFPGGAGWRDNPRYCGYTDKESGIFLPGMLYTCQPKCKAHPEGGKTHSDYFDSKMSELTPQEIAQEFEMDAMRAGGSVFRKERVQFAIDTITEKTMDGSLKIRHFDLKFNPTTSTEFMVDDVELYMERSKWPVRAIEIKSGPFMVWKMPFSCRDRACKCKGTGMHVYVIGADTSSGYTSSDPCAAGVWDSTAGEMAALLHARLSSTELAKWIVMMAKWYGTSSGDDIDAWVGIEANQEGATVNRVVSQHGILLHKSNSDDKWHPKGKEYGRPGIVVNRANRASLLSENIELEVNGGEGQEPPFKCPFIEVWQEMPFFLEVPTSKMGVQKPDATKKSAQNKKKDDLIWTSNHCLYASRCRYAGKVRDVLRPPYLRFAPVNFLVVAQFEF